jgi:hypothetical protein
MAGPFAGTRRGTSPAGTGLNGGGRMDPLQTIRMVGWRSAFWYARYRLELLSGISRRRTPFGGWDSAVRGLPDAYADWKPDSQSPFFIGDPSVLRKDLRRISPRAAAPLAREIRGLRKGVFRLWEDGTRECGFPPAWNSNTLSGEVWNTGRHWTEEDDRSGGDIKGVWELSRFSFAFRLARCYAFHGEERAAETFWRLVESWMTANPPNAGPQWMSAQEAALRAMAWVFGIRTFARSPATTPERAARMIAALELHAHRIEATLAYARAQNNNHLISEAAGLFTIGVMFPDLPRAETWRRRGRTLLKETAGQFFLDGGYIQHSHNYQRLALQLYLWSMRLAELHGRAMPEMLYRCVDRSIDLLDRMIDPRTGRMPNFGHNDGSLFLPTNACVYEDYRPLLQTLSVWRRKEKIFPDGPWNEDAVWWLGADVLRAAKRPPAARQRRTKAPYAAPRAGLYVLHGKDSRAVVRCARFRERPAHADQLHVDLWWRGENVAADAGSYLYSGDEPWRNGLAFTGVHNTVMVDGKDQMTRTGRFLWTHIAQGTGAYAGEGVWRGEHNGYRRWGVIHRRSVESRSGDRWIIHDEILGRGSHQVRLHWLTPDYSWRRLEPVGQAAFRKILSEYMPDWEGGAGVGLRLRTPAGMLALMVWTDRQAKWSLYRAGERMDGEEEQDGPVPAAIRGWRSLYYARKIPALSLSLTAAGECPSRIISCWLPLTRLK